MKLTFSAFVLLAAFAPISAFAILHCEGSLTQNDFAAERTRLQSELQSNIYKYRKLEGNVSGGTEANKAEMDKVMAEIQIQKTKFKQLDSKYFPSTPVTAFGAACTDKRWVEEAKAKLVEKPEQLGKQWYVWLDKTTRKPQAALERPDYEKMAE